MRLLLAVAIIALFVVPSSAVDEDVCQLYNPDCQDYGVEVGTYRDDSVDFDKIDPVEVDRVMIPPTTAEAEEIKKWIPSVCCRTNNCCRKVRAETIAPAGGPGVRNLYRVEETGQEKVRLRWSQNSYTWRCACDFVHGKGWVVHPKANTRCIFPAPFGS